MAENDVVMLFESDSMFGAVFKMVSIPDELRDKSGYVNTYDVLDAIEESADWVDDETGDDGMPGQSGHFYEVHASDVDAFKEKLTERITALLQNVAS